MDTPPRPSHGGLYAICVLILLSFLLLQGSEWTEGAAAQGSPELPPELADLTHGDPTPPEVVARALRAALQQYRRRWPDARIEEAVAAILEAEKRFGVDALLQIALFAEESNLDSTCISPMGAVGLAQLLPNTAALVARKHRIPYGGAESLSDLRTSILLGSAYVDDLLTDFDGNLVAALTAYNRGPGATERRFFRHGYSSDYAWKVMARLRVIQGSVSGPPADPPLEPEVLPSFNSLSPAPGA